MYAGVSGWPIDSEWVFSSVISDVIGSWTSFGSRTAARMAAGIDRAVVRRGDPADRRADDDRMPGGLARERVDLGRPDDLAAARDVGHEADKVAHRAARDQETRLGAEQLGGPLLEGPDGRVLAKDVVAELGLGHRPAHLRRGQRDGVGSQVDHGRR